MQGTFPERYGPWAVIVGAAQGLGAEFARQLAGRGLHLVLVDLVGDEQKALAAELEDAHGIGTRTIAGDVTSTDVQDQIGGLAAELEVGLLVYNAGLSATEPWLDTPLDRHLAIVDLNARGPLQLLDRLVPSMVERGRGGIVLLSSMSGLQGTPLTATYAATKAFTLNLAESLWDEWRPLGVDVTALVPGPTDTPGYRASAPKPTRLTAAPMPVEPAVAAALAALGSRPWVVPGRSNKVAGFVLSRVLPRRRAVGFMGRTMRAMYGRDES